MPKWTEHLEYTCPYCGRKVSFSRRTERRFYDCDMWSDNQVHGDCGEDTLNLLKCDKCSKYFFRSLQQPIPFEYNLLAEECDMKNGRVYSYEDVKAALLQFEAEGYPNAKVEFETRLKFLQKYNTEFIRPLVLPNTPRYEDPSLIEKLERERKNPMPEDRDLFKQTAYKLSNNQGYGDLQICTIIRAEFLREIGSFEDAEKLLNSIRRPKNENISYYIRQIISKIHKQDRYIFPLDKFIFDLSEYRWKRN